MKAVIIAAGKGVRLRPITDEIPKCMAELKGKPMMEHVLVNLKKAGIEECHLVVGYKKDVIEEHFGPEFEGMKLNYFVQEEPKGTAHAVSLVEEYIDGKFLITNADVIVGSQNYQALIKTDEFDKADGVLLARKVKDPWRYGVLKTEGQKIIDIIEKPAPGKEPSNLINAGVYRFSKDFFEAIRETQLSERNEYELVDSIKIYMKKGKNMEFRNCIGMCVDVATKADLEEADSILDELFPM
ncbi:MAG: sugar phosphate nucleotidyltransferase [archaeon]|nr:sugar phosphate nucleotidyltransferase [archaeon]